MGEQPKYRVKKYCPRCNKFEDTRLVDTEPGINPGLKHWVCDHCCIGLYEVRGAGNKRLMGDLASARKAYIPKPVTPGSHPGRVYDRRYQR